MLQWLCELMGAPTLSRLLLGSVGLGMAAFLTWFLVPRMLRGLPTDRGRQFAYGSEASEGKPTGVGVIFIPFYVLTCVIVVPFHLSMIGVLVCTLLAMLAGYLDDRSAVAWGEYRKGLADLVIAALAAVSICELAPVTMWLPFVSGPLVVEPLLYVPLATALLWISINATNCTDGVDGLSGSLLLLAFLYLGAILYGAVGQRSIAEYLNLPHYPMGAEWAIMAVTLSGTLAGYLWHNAKPSRVLMGDAGSRALGLLLGVFVLVSGNPFLILVVAAVVLVNGGTGLVKVALLRFFKIGIFRNVRFPLHDHCRKEWGWSDGQVLMRFILLQAVLAPLLIVLLFRVL